MQYRIALFLNFIGNESVANGMSFRHAPLKMSSPSRVKNILSDNHLAGIFCQIADAKFGEPTMGGESGQQDFTIVQGPVNLFSQ